MITPSAPARWKDVPPCRRVRVAALRASLDALGVRLDGYGRIDGTPRLPPTDLYAMDSARLLRLSWRLARRAQRRAAA